MIRITILIPCFINITDAQNIVQNWSLETFSTCPSTGGQINYATYWSNPTSPTLASPDYFNSCDVSNALSVPFNVFGYQFAKNGQAYAGIYVATRMITNGPLEGREYIQNVLSDTLRKGKNYCVEFYVSRADYSTVAITKIGAYLSNTAIYANTVKNLAYSPQIVSPSGLFIIDTLNWTKISGIYTSIGGEKYITIGNFNDVANTDSLFMPITAINARFSYYYIDDVSITECDTTTTISSLMMPNIFTPNNDGTNDVFSIPSKNIKILNCKIYNRWGILVGELKNANEVWDGRTTAGLECTDGVYYYVLIAKGLDEKEYNEKGFVQLMK